MSSFLRDVSEFKPMGLWIRDRKPTRLVDVIGNSDICQIFQRYLDKGNLPNVILTGEHGTGKRTIAHIVSTSYLGEYHSSASLEIDGAIYRGKDVISTNSSSSNTTGQGLPAGSSVLNFASYKMYLPPGRHKIIIIYNFDNMTVEAQNALRTIMEKHASSTRFILICNSTSDIIEAIQSRCIQLKTQGLSYTEADQLFTKMLPNADPEIKDLVITLSDGDYKRLINYAQVIGRGNCETPMNIDVFYNLFNIPPIKTIKKILSDIYLYQTEPEMRCSDGEDKNSSEIYSMIHTYLVEPGHTYSSIIDTVRTVLIFDTECGIPDHVRFRWLQLLSELYSKITLSMNDVHSYALFGLLIKAA